MSTISSTSASNSASLSHRFVTETGTRAGSATPTQRNDTTGKSQDTMPFTSPPLFAPSPPSLSPNPSPAQGVQVSGDETATGVSPSVNSQTLSNQPPPLSFSSKSANTAGEIQFKSSGKGSVSVSPTPRSLGPPTGPSSLATSAKGGAGGNGTAASVLNSLNSRGSAAGAVSGSTATNAVFVNSDAANNAESRNPLKSIANAFRSHAAGGKSRVGGSASANGGPAAPAVGTHLYTYRSHQRSQQNSEGGPQLFGTGMGSVTPNNSNSNNSFPLPSPRSACNSLPPAPQNVYTFLQTCAYKGSQGRLFTRPNGIYFNSAAQSFQIAWRSVTSITANNQNIGGQFVPIITIKVGKQRGHAGNDILDYGHCGSNSSHGAEGDGACSNADGRGSEQGNNSNSGSSNFYHGHRSASVLAEAFAFTECNGYRMYCKREARNVSDAVVDHMRALSGLPPLSASIASSGASAGLGKGGGGSSFAMSKPNLFGGGGVGNGGLNVVSPFDSLTALEAAGSPQALPSAQNSPNTIIPSDSIDAMAEFLSKEVAAHRSITAAPPPPSSSLLSSSSANKPAPPSKGPPRKQHRHLGSVSTVAGGDDGGAKSPSQPDASEAVSDTTYTVSSPSPLEKVEKQKLAAGNAGGAERHTTASNASSGGGGEGGGRAAAEATLVRSTNLEFNTNLVSESPYDGDSGAANGIRIPSPPKRLGPICCSRSISGASMIGPLSTLAAVAGTEEAELAPSGTYVFTVQAYNGDAQAIATRLREQMTEHYRELCLLAIEQRRYDLIAVIKGSDAASIVESASALHLEFNSMCISNPPRHLGDYFQRLIEASTAIFIRRSRSAAAAGQSGGSASRSVWGPRLHSVAKEVVQRTDDMIVHYLNNASSRYQQLMLSSTLRGSGAAGGGSDNTSSAFFTSNPSFQLGRTFNNSSYALTAAAAASSAASTQRVTDAARDAFATMQRKQGQQQVDPSNFPLLYQTTGTAVAPRRHGVVNSSGVGGTPLAGGNSGGGGGGSGVGPADGRNRVGFSDDGAPKVQGSTNLSGTTFNATAADGVASGGLATEGGDGGGGGMLRNLLLALFMEEGSTLHTFILSPALSAFRLVDQALIDPISNSIAKRVIPKQFVRSRRKRVKLTRAAMLCVLGVCWVYFSLTIMRGSYSFVFPPPTAEELTAMRRSAQLEATEKVLREFLYGDEALWIEQERAAVRESRRLNCMQKKKRSMPIEDSVSSPRREGEHTAADDAELARESLEERLRNEEEDSVRLMNRLATAYYEFDGGGDGGGGGINVYTLNASIFSSAESDRQSLTTMPDASQRRILVTKKDIKKTVQKLAIERMEAQFLASPASSLREGFPETFGSVYGPAKTSVFASLLSLQVIFLFLVVGATIAAKASQGL